MLWTTLVVSAIVAAGELPPAQGPGALQHAVRVLARVGPDGKGAREAAAAWPVVARAQPAELPILLAGMDHANDVARNWIRSALDPVLERARAETRTLPRDALTAFLLDRRHDPQARRLVFDLLTAGNEVARKRFLAGMLDDPSPELRHDAVAAALSQANQLRTTGKKDEARTLFQQAFAAARERKQLDEAAHGLRELGQTVDMAAHLGMIQRWRLIGPFPDPHEKGLDTVFPPEQTMDLSANYEGKKGKVTWKTYASKDPYGLVDLKTGLADEPASVAYALASVQSPGPLAVDVRVGCYNAFKLWVNGQLILDRRDAFTGMSLDHYQTRAQLKAGRNVILVKVCREDAPSGVPQLCQFQLRITDASGQAIPSLKQ